MAPDPINEPPPKEEVQHPIPSVLLQPMPIPRTVGAPLFDGKYVREFISIIERHGAIAGLVSSQLPAYILQYCSTDVKKVIRWSEELDGTDWDAVKELLIGLYGSSDKPTPVTIDDLRDFIKDTRSRREFTRRVDIDRYHQGFLAIAGQLKKKGELGEDEMKLKFLAGLPAATRSFLTTRLPEKNKEVKDPPLIPQMIKIISDRFNPKSIEYYGYESEDGENQEQTAAPHITITPVTTITEPVKLPNVANNKTPKPRNDTSIEALTQQLQQLSLSQAQLMSALSGLSSSSNQTTKSSEKKCFICGLPGTHRLHPRYCQETAKLITEKLITFANELQRYTLMDGSNLPVVPYYPGGIAQYLRDERAKSTSGPGNATASIGSVYLNGHQALREGIIPITQEDYEDMIHSNAVTRTGKDTTARMNPYQKLEHSKAKSSPPNIPNKPTAQVPRSNHPTQPPNLPTPPSINTQEGWKEGRSGKPKDVKMKDVNAKDEPKRGTPQYHFTSDIQEQVSIDAIQNAIFDQKITVSLRDIIGISPALQKKITDSTKTRREYSTKTGEYDIIAPEAEQVLAQTSYATVRETMKNFYMPDTDEIQTFLVRHSNAVALKPTKMLAMTTGVFTAKFCGQSLKFMVDTGSELNLIPERLLSISGLALDFAGSQWSLKGVNGDPVGLRGCCMDVEVQIGSHRFDHHFFVSREDMRGHDVLLGQPWIQWYAARIDYDREGVMKMMVWHDGDRSHQPSLALQLTVPDDPRNVTAFRRNHAAAYEETAYGPYEPRIEEVSEDEVDHF